MERKPYLIAELICCVPGRNLIAETNMPDLKLEESIVEMNELLTIYIKVNIYFQGK